MTLAERVAHAIEKDKVPKPREEDKPARYCPWCAPTAGGAGYCVCDRKCGEANCPYNEQEFVMPPVPVFKQEEVADE